MEAPTNGIPTIEEYIERANQWLNIRRKTDNTISSSYYNYLNEVTLLRYWLIPYYSFLNDKMQTQQYRELNQRLQDSIQTFFEQKTTGMSKGDNAQTTSEERLKAARRLKDEAIDICCELGIPSEMVDDLLKYPTLEKTIEDKEIEI